MTITFETPREVSVPINYNYFLSSLIYENLPESSDHLHESGFLYEKRNFKLFTFSRLNGQYLVKGQNLVFTGNVNFTFSTAMDGIAEEFAKSIIAKESVRLGSAGLKTSSVYMHGEPEFSDHIFIRMLSPVTMYSTLLTKEGKKKTYYYSPYEKEFSALIDSNLRKKYFIVKGKSSDAPPVSIAPIGRQREVLVNFKGTIIKGWMGVFELRGDRELIKVAYDAGLGSKNSEGFGCFDVIRRDPERSPK